MAQVTDDDATDPTLNALMRETFGPPADSPGDDRIERGMAAVEQLSETADGAIRWLHASEQLAPSVLPTTRLCFRCGKPEPKSSCAKCGVAGYCGRDCQLADWGKKGEWGGHKSHCAIYRALGRSQCITDGRAVVERLLTRLRLYICPFALAHGSGGGEGKPRGCLFVQVGCSLSHLALPAPRDCAGHRLQADERQCMIDFISPATFEAEIAPSDATLATLVAPLAGAVANHDDRAEAVVLLRASCGYTLLLVQPLVPEWRVAKAMAEQYANVETLQIDLDDASLG